MKLFILGLLSFLQIAVTQEARSTCSDITFTVNGSAQNRELSGISLSNSSELLATLMDDVFSLVPVTGSQTLAGTYCLPMVTNANSDKLQVFFHGITSNRGYWSALGGPDFPEYQPGNYSWVDVATAKGYPTLALDRLGSGESSHPDPILVVQGPYEYVRLSQLDHDC